MFWKRTVCARWNGFAGLALALVGLHVDFVSPDHRVTGVSVNPWLNASGIPGCGTNNQGQTQAKKTAQ